jgi:hypothetical protein
MSTPSKPKMSELQTGPSQPASAWGSVEELFGKQKSYFTTDATKAYAWPNRDHPGAFRHGSRNGGSRGLHRTAPWSLAI